MKMLSLGIRATMGMTAFFLLVAIFHIETYSSVRSKLSGGSSVPKGKLAPSLTRVPARAQVALDYIHKLQHPLDCSVAQLVKIRIGYGGGFGSKFQYLASQFAAAVQANRTVVFLGDLGGYTSNRECRGQGWACFFEPVSGCQGYDTEMIPESRTRVSKWDDIVPPLMREYKFDPMEWWGAVQYYLFRLNQKTEALVSAAAEEMKWDLFATHIGLHIRQGDKLTDWSGRVGTFDHRAESYLRPALALIKHLNERVLPSTRRFQVFVATDNPDVCRLVKEEFGDMAASLLGKSCDVSFIMADGSSTFSMYGDGNQRVADLIGNGRVPAYRLALEIITDIYFLSKSEYHFGLCMSQPTRIAVSLGRFAGNMVANFAMDFEAKGRMSFMKLGDSEGWKKPPDPLRK